MEIVEFADTLTKEQLEAGFKIVSLLFLTLAAIVTRAIVSDYISHRKQIHSIRDWLARSFGYDPDE